MALGQDTAFLEINSVNSYELPGQGAEIYLELDYRTNYEFTAGFRTNDFQQIPILSLYPTDTLWRKAYISLREDVSEQEAGKKYTVFFGSIKNFRGYGKIYIDNIKLLRFE